MKAKMQERREKVERTNKLRRQRHNNEKEGRAVVQCTTHTIISNDMQQKQLQLYHEQ